MSAKTDNFIKKYSRYAIIEGVRNNVPPSITLAQAILESGWGESGLSLNANNFFGIKANSSWKGNIYNADTHEYYNGVLTYTSDDFRAYKTPLQSFKDHSIFLKENKRYSNLFALDFLDYKGWAKGLKSSGYATSPTYAEKLINLIEQYDLNKFDKRAKSLKTLGYIGLVILITIFTILLIKKFKK